MNEEKDRLFSIRNLEAPGSGGMFSERRSIYEGLIAPPCIPQLQTKKRSGRLAVDAPVHGTVLEKMHPDEEAAERADE